MTDEKEETISDAMMLRAEEYANEKLYKMLEPFNGEADLELAFLKAYVKGILMAKYISFFINE